MYNCMYTGEGTNRDVLCRFNKNLKQLFHFTSTLEYATKYLTYSPSNLYKKLPGKLF